MAGNAKRLDIFERVRAAVLQWHNVIVLPSFRHSAARSASAAVALSDALASMRAELHHVRIDAPGMPIQPLIRLSVMKDQLPAKSTFTARSLRKRYGDSSMTH
jgi:hypothetical protein